MALFQYWNRLRGNRPAPRRTEIEPADIKTLLADTFILERDGRGEPMFRLAGTRICATYGRELKGHSFLSLWSASDQATVRRLLHHALDEGAVVVISFEGATSGDRLNNFELVVLPLDGCKEGPRALGTVQPFMKPFWLGADPIVENRVVSFRLIDPDEEPVILRHRPAVPVPTLSPDGEMLTSQLNGRRIGHLVVLEGGRRE